MKSAEQFWGNLIRVEKLLYMYDELEDQIRGDKGYRKD